MADNQCPFLIDDSKGNYKKGKCQIDNGDCAYIRYCKDKKKIVSSPMYTIYGCIKEKKYKER